MFDVFFLSLVFFFFVVVTTATLEKKSEKTEQAKIAVFVEKTSNINQDMNQK